MADAREAALATALSHQQSGRHADAERLYREIAADAGSGAIRARALAGLGAIQLARGERDEAIASCVEAVALAPDLAEANFGLAGAYLASNRAADALAVYEKALAAHPDFLEGYFGMGAALGLLQRNEEAVAAYGKALDIDPDFAEAACALGRTLNTLERHEEALRRFEQALDVDPDYVEALFGRGTAQLALKRHTDALATFDKVLTAQPNNAGACHGRARALIALGLHEEALQSCERALALRPGDAKIAYELAHILDLMQRPDDAIAACERAIALDPNFAGAHQELGSLLAIKGQIEDARAAFDKAIALEPRNPRHYVTAAATRRVERGSLLLQGLEALLGEIDALPEHDQTALHLALGKAYADLGEHERSFQHFLAGRTLRRPSLVYDEKQWHFLHDRIQEIFTPSLMRSRAGAGDPSTVPIFIVGMPRSGTTLTEQIIASHPDVFGGGERTDLGTIVGPTYPDRVPGTTQRALRKLGEAYVTRLTALAPAAARITDKLPANYIYIGLIRLAMPNARIIHMRRDPIDTCLSCFTTLFSRDHLPYVYDLGELGRYFRAYVRLMAHWRTLLGPDGFLEVDYETLVADFEPQARRIIDYCGLPWNDSCLAFHETQRTVRTASVVQVRQPIYNSSVGKWRPPDSILKPLLDSIASEGP
jgi:tetratricopeptide (TPR) repeat protein